MPLSARTDDRTGDREFVSMVSSHGRKPTRLYTDGELSAEKCRESSADVVGDLEMSSATGVVEAEGVPSAFGVVLVAVVVAVFETAVLEPPTASSNASFLNFAMMALARSAEDPDREDRTSGEPAGTVVDWETAPPDAEATLRCEVMDIAGERDMAVEASEELPSSSERYSLHSEDQALEARGSGGVLACKPSRLSKSPTTATELDVSTTTRDMSVREPREKEGRPSIAVKAGGPMRRVVITGE
eukprot:TRINITY_DN32618_c0_g1_i2.p2 TRINITY_DN32618_c0_g1~~TRINITY_DN32618_c0_g1_i2.p2  ORF type:complete len:244 (+),score=42.63 TRINITY_DN32618_c0_g1_i2:1077-1808(+)